MQSSHGHRHLMCRLHYRRSMSRTELKSQAITLTLLLVCSFSPRVQSIPRGAEICGYICNASYILTLSKLYFGLQPKLR